MSTQHTPCHPPHAYPRGMARRLRFDQAVYRFPLPPLGACLLACLYLLGRDACAICIITSARLTCRPLHACLLQHQAPKPEESLKMGRLDIFMLFAGLTTQQSASQPLLQSRLSVPGSARSTPDRQATGQGAWQ
jgi:hypothetical protein